MASLGTRGPWTKLQAIGKGSFGTVYLVQRTGAGNQQKYVMKEVNLRGLPKAEMLAAQNEVAALQKVKHPHAVAIADALVVDDTLCIIMEWAQGKDLGALIAQRKTERRPFTEDEVLKIFWQLTSVLAHCHHELHLLHRDLKPQNVFLSANGDVKLGDFGLAKALEATCAIAKTQCGTPIYMSPELCLGQDYNRAADVWALGCILYELMTLTMPWADCRVQGPGGMSALLKKIASSSLDLTQCKKQYSAELCGLLSALLHKKGENRPALDQVLQLPFIARAATPRTAATTMSTTRQRNKRPRAVRPDVRVDVLVDVVLRTVRAPSGKGARVLDRDASLRWHDPDQVRRSNVISTFLSARFTGLP
jgi:NIMA (never in mitosis gene a)-related kinase